MLNPILFESAKLFMNPIMNFILLATERASFATQRVISNPLPDIEVQNYKNTAIEYEVQFYIQDYFAIEDIQAEFMARVYYAAKRYKFTLPYGDKVEYKMGEFPQELGMTTEEITASLKTLPYFTFLDEKTIKQLAFTAIVEHFGIGERIIQAGEFDRKMYIILEGSV